MLILDRFETIDAGDRISWKARGRDTMLFDGFSFDLDSGQVVPDGFGGDIRLTNQGADGPELSAVGASKLYTFEKPLPVAPTSPGRPSSGRAVLPTDFSGRYNLMANGQMSGTLDLSVNPDGMVSGQFRSDRNGSVYPVTGKVAADLARKIEFTIQFPRSEQVYQGLLWTEEKSAIAGTVQILDHPFSFFAIREGAALAGDAIDLDRTLPAAIARGTTNRVVTIEEAADRYTLDGESKSAAELSTALAAVVKAQPECRSGSPRPGIRCPSNGCCGRPGSSARPGSPRFASGERPRAGLPTKRLVLKAPGDNQRLLPWSLPILMCNTVFFFVSFHGRAMQSWISFLVSIV